MADVTRGAGPDPAPGLSPQEDASASRLGLAVGLVISVLLSAALVISAAKAGITPGVSPLVVLFGWVVFGVALGPRLKRFLAIAQVTGSAGAAVTAGVVFTAPIIQILYAERGLEVPAVDVPVLILGSIAGSLLGFGFVGLATKRFLTDPRLPAPEAVAADRLIETAVENPDERPRLGISLVAGLFVGFVAQGAMLLHWLEEKVYDLTFSAPFLSSKETEAEVELPVPVAPLYLGIGALLTLPTAILIFAGGLVNAGTTAFAAAHAMPGTTFRWVGGAAMVVAVVFSLVAYVIEGRRKRLEETIAARGGAAAAQALAEPDGTQAALHAAVQDESLLEQSVGIKRMLVGSIVMGLLLLLAMMALVGGSPLTLGVMGITAFILVSLLSGLGGLLSLQVGSSASPVSGTVFMGMLVLSLTGLYVANLEGMSGVVFLVPIVVAACVAICAANDSSQDYKTMQLNGFRVSDGFKGQIIGLVGGSIAVPLTLWVAHDAFILGSDNLPSPQASFFSTVLNSLFLEAEIPWGPVGAGALLGLAAVGLELVGKARGVILSSLAFAVGIYLPSYIGTGIMMGALARFFATRKVTATTHEGILNAAGLITGDAFASLILGILIVAGSRMEPMWDPTTAWAPVDGIPWAKTVGGALVVAMVVLVFVNYVARQRRSS